LEWLISLQEKKGGTEESKGVRAGAEGEAVKWGYLMRCLLLLVLFPYHPWLKKRTWLGFEGESFSK